MPIRRTLSILTLIGLGTALLRADEVRTLDNKTVTGTVVEVTDKEIAVKTEGGTVVKTPLNEVLALDLRQVKGVPPGTKYSDVRLFDNTLLHCNKVAFKGKQVELTLLSGQQVKVAIDHLASILHDAQDPQIQKGWATILGEESKRDRIVILGKDEDLNPIPGTFGEVGATGETIQFRLESSGATRTLRLDNEKLKGLIFFRTETPAKSPICEVQDVQGNTLSAAAVKLNGTRFTVTTVGGLEISYDQQQIARFDYNMGKLTYLSALTPVKVVEKSGVGLPIAYRKDLNLDGDPIILGDKTFPKGLSMHAYTQLEYDLGGKYKEFKAFIGVDPRVGSESKAHVTIEADNQKLYSKDVTTATPLRQESLLLPKKASRLRITVSSSNILDLHDHVTLADAKVSQ
jgi:hypothetical protein